VAGFRDVADTAFFWYNRGMTKAVIKSLLVPLLVALIFLSLPACYSPPHPQPLGDYLKDLFESQEIILDKDDFFEPVEDPYLAFAKMLDLIPSSYQSDQRITQRTADQISEQLLAIRDYILLDGLYGKIDMHEHYRAGADVEVFFAAAGCLGISRVVFLPTGNSPDNAGYETHQEALINQVKPQYPDRVIAFCTIDESDPNAAEIFEQCLQDGAEGLKLIGGHPDFYDDPLNSENMYRVYQKAAEYGVPVLLHGSIINIPELREQLDQVYSDFPEVTFIHAHYCSTIMNGINLDQCAELLDRHPNLYIDISMGGGIARYQRYFRQDLDKIRDFILAYQDRILFGSDIILSGSTKDFDWIYQRIKCDIDLHQQVEYICPFGEGEGEDVLHPGFNLDREVLRKLYYENPKQVLGW
jgi:predicted TIM-barrel fold metal-dependent hydrolase